MSSLVAKHIDLLITLASVFLILFVLLLILIAPLAADYERKSV